MIVSGFLSLYGGFRVNHIDTEYPKTLYNKSYFLYNIYHVTSQLELEAKKLFQKNNHFIQKTNIKNFKQSNQRHGISLYLVNGFFSLLGIFFCFRLTFLFTNNFWLSYLAGSILSTCYFWNAEAHYPTTDIALSSLIITTLYFLIQNLIDNKELDTEEKIYEGLLLGACFSVKYAGIIILIPYLYLKYKNDTFKQSIISIAIAIVFLAICISDKFKELWRYCVVEYKVQTEIGWAGYNSHESGFIYHIKHSLITEYGLLLTILSLIGIYYAYSNFKNDEYKFIAYKIIILFLVSLSIMISSTIIKTVRFALPLIPFLSLFSAMGIYQIYILLKRFNSNLAKILITILILFSTGPTLKDSIKHNYLMAKPDTADFVMNLCKVLQSHGATSILLDDKQLFDKTPNQNDIEYIKRCSSPAKDFRRIFKFDEYPEVHVSMNSFILDRFVFDTTYHCDNNHKAFTNYEDLKLLQINPFSVKKDLVPFSFISNFSPRKPDLKYRNFKGGFFEIFYVSPLYEEIMRKECETNNYPCTFTTGKDSYFLTKIQTSFVDPKVRKKLKEEIKNH